VPRRAPLAPKRTRKPPRELRMFLRLLRLAAEPEPHQLPLELRAHVVLAHGTNGRVGGTRTAV
jgi:hypothetical protein